MHHGLEELTEFVAVYCKNYISSGGPTSRLEDDVVALGNKYGAEIEIYATPTGVFLSASNAQNKVITKVTRIKDGGMNLQKICWLETVLRDLMHGKIQLNAARKVMASKQLMKAPYKTWQTILAAFLVGFALSYPSYQNFRVSTLGGLIAVCTWWVAGPALRGKISSSIFRDFFGCMVMLALAGLCEFILPAPFDAYTIGGTLILVPGLILTTAIAELADQNLVSGTAKLMQAGLTILALGLASILFYDLSQMIGVPSSILSIKKPSGTTLASMLGVIISISSFGIIFRVPLKSLPWSTVTGFCGWLVLQFFSQTKYLITASFCSSFVVGVISLWIGSKFQVPSQVFSVPGILALLPGVLAFSSFQSFALGQESSGVDLAFRVVLTAGSIVFGLFTARIPFAIRLPKKRHRATGKN